MSTLEDEFAALPEATGPSLEDEFAALAPVPTVRLSPEQYLKQAAEERKAVEAAASEKTRKAFEAEHPYRAALGTALQQFSKGATFGATGPLISALGVPSEEQARFAEEMPIAATTGTALGIAAQIPLGMAAFRSVAAAPALAETAAAARAAAGGGKLAQSLAAARAAATVAPATLAGEVAAPVLAAGARAGAAIEAGLQTLAPELAKSVVGKGAMRAATGIAMTAPFALARVINENAIEGREISGEAIAAELGVGGLLNAAIPGAFEGLQSTGAWIGKTQAGKSLASWLGRNRAERIYGAHAPSIKAKVMKQTGPAETHAITNEAADAGLVGEFMPGMTMLEKSAEALDKNGETIGQIAKLTDEGAGSKPVNISQMWDKITSDVVEPMSSGMVSPEEEKVARRVADTIESYRNRLEVENGSPDVATMSQLSDIRTSLSKLIYGFNRHSLTPPDDSRYAMVLSDIRGHMTDEIGHKAVESGIPLNMWKAAQRQYQVAAHAERIAAESVRRTAAPVGAGNVASLKNAFSVAAAFSRGVPSGIATKIGLEALGYAGPRATRGLADIARRELTPVEAPALPAEFESLAAQRAAAAEAIGSTVGVKPERVARDEFNQLHARVLDTIPNVAPEFREPLQQIADNMDRAYRKALQRVPESGPLGLDIDALGDALVASHRALETLSAPSAGRVEMPMTRSFVSAQKPSLVDIQGLRGDFASSLGNTAEVWGPRRARDTINALERLVEVHQDPVRMTQLRALQEATVNARRRITDKSDKLMGAVVAARTLYSKKKQREFEQAQEEAIQRARKMEAEKQFELMPEVAP